jgi:hypothetical protein
MVRQALACAQPSRKTPVRAAPRLDPVKALIEVMLIEDLDAPRKQRHTAGWVLARLVDEHPSDRDHVFHGAGLRVGASRGDLGGEPVVG